MTRTSPKYLSVNDAAAQLGVKPHEVVRLIERGEIQAVTLVEERSLRELQER